jgi:hypothetical protein
MNVRRAELGGRGQRNLFLTPDAKLMCKDNSPVFAAVSQLVVSQKLDLRLRRLCLM